MWERGQALRSLHDLDDQDATGCGITVLHLVAIFRSGQYDRRTRTGCSTYNTPYNSTVRTHTPGRG
jgi:hypothetical protein